MRLKSFPFFALFTIHCSLSTVVFAAHPLITDDTGTQGKGKLQLEVNGEITKDKETKEGITTREKTGGMATTLSYGIGDNVDIILGMPYQWRRVRKNEVPVSDANGISDLSLEAKWKFFEMDKLSLGLKPGITLPTGDEKKGLGNGRPSYRITFITTKEVEPWEFHLNLGYAHNGYKLREDKDSNRKDIWHVSLAAEFEVIEHLELVANIGTERNPDKSSGANPAFVLGGLIYEVTRDFDIDFGVKRGLNRPETDYSYLAGITVRF